MRRPIPARLTALLLCCASAALQAAPSDASETIQAAYSSMSMGIMQKNLAKACAYLSPNFTNSDGSGMSEKLQGYQSGLSVLFAEYVSIRVRVNVRKVTYTSPGRAVATARYFYSATYVNPTTLQRTHSTHTEVDQDVWGKTSQGWVQKSSRTIPGSATNTGQSDGPVL